MQEHEVRELMERMIATMSPELEHAARHAGFVVEFPQSGERLDRDGLRRLQEHFPGGAPRIHLRRLTGAGDAWVVETVIRYTDGTVRHGVAVLEFRDGLMWRDTRYFAEPFDPPEWRADRVLRPADRVAG